MVSPVLNSPQPRTDGKQISVALTVPCTEAEGPGRRFAVWFQGCPLRCPGCCNPEMLPLAGGTFRAVADLLSEIRGSQQDHDIEGITLLGGEPFAQPAGARCLCEGAQSMGLTVMIFSGFTLEQLRATGDPDVHGLLAATDILVDGPYLRDRPETERRWVGSANQRLHFLSDRCSPDDPAWRRKNTVELRWHAAGLTVNGFPAPGLPSFAPLEGVE